MERCKKDIAVLVNVRNKLMEADKQGLWEYHFPEVAATHEEVMEVEGKLNLTLGEEYETFLLCANGWKCFFQMVDLFGTNVLLRTHAPVIDRCVNGSDPILHRECHGFCILSGVFL